MSLHFREIFPEGASAMWESPVPVREWFYALAHPRRTRIAVAHAHDSDDFNRKYAAEALGRLGAAEAPLNRRLVPARCASWVLTAEAAPRF